MKKTLTYCFYQENAAETELDNWEKANEHRINSKRTEPYRDKFMTIFEIAHLEDPEIEMLVCIPTSIQGQLDDWVKKEVESLVPEHVYKKTLFFGKITKENAYELFINFLRSAE